MRENIGEEFDRVARTAEEKVVSGRPSRAEILSWWDDRFGIPRRVFDRYSFWEKGKGKIWIVSGDVDSPIRVQALGMRCLRVRQQFWKPTTNAIQRFGGMASKNRVVLSSRDVANFVRGASVMGEWDVDDGYVIVMKTVNNSSHPVGVGLYVNGELQSQIPKSRQRNLQG